MIVALRWMLVGALLASLVRLAWSTWRVWSAWREALTDPLEAVLSRVDARPVPAGEYGLRIDPLRPPETRLALELERELLG